MSKEKQIKDKLSQYFKNHQPVLLYNDTSNKRSNIILDIHIENGGSLYDVKYGGNKEKRVFLQDIADERNEKERGIKRTIKDCIGTFERFQLDETQREIHNKVRKNFKGKKKAYRCFDCAGKNGKSVFDLLINYHFWDEVKIPDSRYGLIPIESMPGNEFLKDYRNPVIIYGSNLFGYKGTLFVDNLKCSNSEDVLYYYKLAGDIRNNKISVNWLVVYVHNRDNFPRPFLNQFESVSLDGEEAGVGPAVKTYIEEQKVSYPILVKVYCTPGFQRLEYQEEKPKLNNIWLRLLKFLWEKNGALATRDEIREELWGKNEKEKDAQITIIAGRLRKAFEDIGFKKEMVRQQIITTRSDTFTDHGRGGGGYRFLRGIVLLDFH